MKSLSGIGDRGPLPSLHKQETKKEEHFQLQNKNTLSILDGLRQNMSHTCTTSKANRSMKKILKSSSIHRRFWRKSNTLRRTRVWGDQIINAQKCSTNNFPQQTSQDLGSNSKNKNFHENTLQILKKKNGRNKKI